MISNFYERIILPRLCNCCCSIGPIEKQRKKIVPSAKGVVLEIGIGTGLNLPFYNKNNVIKIIDLNSSELKISNIETVYLLETPKFVGYIY